MVKNLDSIACFIDDLTAISILVGYFLVSSISDGNLPGELSWPRALFGLYRVYSAGLAEYHCLRNSSEFSFAAQSSGSYCSFTTGAFAYYWAVFSLFCLVTFRAF